ncbi:UNVERIFIED_CONTAM: hypothetical protein GTU68_019153 [Idotea baltica]|nr:hypothetical protein [Idotea baltica]
MFQYSDALFLSKYRVDKDTFHDICGSISPYCRRSTQRSSPLSPEDVTAIGLRYFATGTFQSVVGDTLGFSQPSTHLAIEQFSTALDDKFNEIIKFPTIDEQLAGEKQEFYRIGNFPNVIGCVDGTHIPIEKPNIHEQRFVNRKHYHSINVQGICDSQGKFINVVARWPGSCHDSYILRSSGIWNYMENNPNIGVILGDSAYPLRSWLMTPIRNPNNRNAANYNYHHSKTRVIIENTFGRWKRRFPLLKFPNRRRTIPTILRDIRVAAVLHNLAIDSRAPDPEDDDDDEHPDNDPDNDCSNDISAINENLASHEGTTKRNFILQNYFS